MSTQRTHAPQSPTREIVLRNVVGERWKQKDVRVAPFEIVVDGKRLPLQPRDLTRVALVCQLLHAEWVKEQADAYAATLEAASVKEADQVKVNDFTRVSA